MLTHCIPLWCKWDKFVTISRQFSLDRHAPKTEEGPPLDKFFIISRQIFSNKDQVGMRRRTPIFYGFQLLLHIKMQYAFLEWAELQLCKYIIHIPKKLLHVMILCVLLEYMQPDCSFSLISTLFTWLVKWCMWWYYMCL